MTMKMKSIAVHFSLLALLLCAVGCNEWDEYDIENPEIVLSTAIYSGAETTRAVATISDYVGRGIDVESSRDKDFESGDKMVLTKIQRTSNTIDRFTYSNVMFSNTNGAWDRTSSPDDRIYWSDSENPHTFIGYSLPSDAFGTSKWKNLAGNDVVFYSCIGDPTKTAAQEIIDYTSDRDAAGNETLSGNEKIKKEDLLLTYSLDQKAETGGSVAKLYFYHALANVRVLVDIYGFSPTSDAPDTESRVFDLMLKNMPTMYKWTQQDRCASPLSASDNVSTLGWDKTLKKDMKTWQPHPEGEGAGQARVFTFYALAVPGSTNFEIPFKVRYPMPLNPTQMQEKEYKALINNVELKAGYCTTIKISLNHQNEDMTVGASYIDWQFVDTPDHGTLRKNSVFLDNTDRTKLTIVGDEKATVDDAVWLYHEYDDDGTLKYDNGKPVIKDIYGHTGDTEADAYQISTAQQLLSFAYEVKGTGRTNETSTVMGGMDFAGKYIKLDADIIMQSKRTADNVNWIGIGDETHAFNGIFLGGDRIISCLKNAALFANLGASAVVENLNIQSLKDMGTATGVLAGKNAGRIEACKINSDVKSTSTSPVGALVGENSGTIQTCYHIGNVASAGPVAGLVGQNTGMVQNCYNAGTLVTSGNSGKYGICAGNTGGTVKYSYYTVNRALLTHSGSLSIPVAPDGGTVTSSLAKSVTDIQKADFVTTLNEGLPAGSYQFVAQSANYPIVRKN